MLQMARLVIKTDNFNMCLGKWETQEGNMVHNFSTPLWGNPLSLQPSSEEKNNESSMVSPASCSLMTYRG